MKEIKVVLDSDLDCDCGYERLTIDGKETGIEGYGKNDRISFKIDGALKALRTVASVKITYERATCPRCNSEYEQ